MRSIGYLAVFGVVFGTFGSSARAVAPPAPEKRDPAQKFILILPTQPDASLQARPKDGMLLPSHFWWLKKASFVGTKYYTVSLGNQVTYTAIVYPKGTMVPKSASDVRYEAFDRLLKTAPGIPAYVSRCRVVVAYRFDAATRRVPDEPGWLPFAVRQLGVSVWALVHAADPDLHPNSVVVPAYDAEAEQVLKALDRLDGNRKPWPWKGTSGPTIAERPRYLFSAPS